MDSMNRVLSLGAFGLIIGLPAAAAAQTNEPAPVGASPAPASQPGSVPELTDEERRAIEQSLSADQAETARAAATPSAAVQSMNPDVGLVLDVALGAFSDDPLQVGEHDPDENGFKLQQLEMVLGSNIDPFFRLDAFLVFSVEGVEVEEAFATTLELPGNLQMRAGKFFTRFGRQNPTHPHAWSFVDKPLVLGKFFGPEASGGPGLEASWLAPLPWYVELVASSNQPESEEEDGAGPEGAGDLMYTAALKQFFPFGASWSLSWGLSGNTAPIGGDGRVLVGGTDVYLRWRPVDSAEREAISIQIEALWRRLDVSGPESTDWGGYGQLVWDANAAWQMGARYERVTGVDGDPTNPDWTDSRQRASLQTTYRPSHFSRIRVQGNYDRPEWRAEPIWAGLLQLEVVAGVHGAHSF